MVSSVQYSMTRNDLSFKFRFNLPTLFAIITVIALYRIKKALTPRFGEGFRDLAARAIRYHPTIEKAFRKEIDVEFKNFCTKTKDKWSRYGEAITEIPEEGLSLKELIHKIDHFAHLTNQPIADCEFSGTIYPNDLRQTKNAPFELSEPATLEEKLAISFQHAFTKAYLWNPLHESEFGIGYFLQYQVVQMVANLYGGDPKKVAGFVTSGGTESLMLAMRIYRNWGMETKGHEPATGVVIAPETVHAAVIKAGEAYLLRIILIPCDDHGKVDMDKMRQAIETYKKQLVCLVGSTPSYRTGEEDDISLMSNWAKESGVGFHVDCCLGGFIIEKPFLKFPGVTSLSCDTHKNGYAPKGSSVLVMKPFGNYHLVTFGAYAIPNWTGGIYGTDRDPGSHSSLPALFSYLALLGTGKRGYREASQSIQACVNKLSEKIKEIFPSEIQLLGVSNRINVIAFRALSEKWGASYALSEKMKEKKMILNEVSGDAAHLCVTKRFTSKDEISERFIQAMKESLKEIKAIQQYPKSTSLYGTIDASFKPSIRHQNFLKHYFFGVAGLKEGIRAYYQALLNPFLEI